jgi:hypothetical protein
MHFYRCADDLVRKLIDVHGLSLFLTAETQRRGGRREKLEQFTLLVDSPIAQWYTDDISKEQGYGY